MRRPTQLGAQRVSTSQRMALSMVSWSNTNPEAVRTLGSARWLPRMSLANSPRITFSASAGGGGVTPGTYTAKLSLGGKDYTKPVTVLEDIWLHER